MAGQVGGASSTTPGLASVEAAANGQIIGGGQAVNTANGMQGFASNGGGLVGGSGAAPTAEGLASLTNAGSAPLSGAELASVSNVGGSPVGGGGAALTSAEISSVGKMGGAAKGATEAAGMSMGQGLMYSSGITAGTQFAGNYFGQKAAEEEAEKRGENMAGKRFSPYQYSIPSAFTPKTLDDLV